jgi:quercetin dioxygenase-like cupin family protein
VTSTVENTAARYDKDREWLLPQGVVARQLATHELAPRPKRKARAAAFDELSGNTTLGVHLSEIAPGGQKLGHRHVDEAVIYIVTGRGWSELRQDDEKPDQRVEWQAGDLISIPANAWHKHYNADPDNPTLQLAFKNTRLLRKLFGSRGFVYANNFRFDDRYADEDDYWTLRERAEDGVIRTNVIRDCLAEELPELPEKAGAGRGVSLQQYEMGGHLMLDVALIEVVRRGYIRPRKLLAEEALYVLSGRGRTHLWQEGGGVKTLKWRAGDLICPPLGVWQEHLTEGHDPARFLLVRNNFIQLALGTGRGLFDTVLPDRFPDVLEPIAEPALSAAEISREP